MSNISEEENKFQNCNDCEKIYKLQIDMVKHMRTEHDRYNTIVCSLGYGSLITILNLVKNDLNIWFTFLCAICLIISIGIFVHLEMDNITKSRNQINSLTTAIYKNYDLNEMMKVYNSFYETEQRIIEKFGKWNPISSFFGFTAAVIILIGTLVPFVPELVKYFIVFILI